MLGLLFVAAYLALSRSADESSPPAIATEKETQPPFHGEIIEVNIAQLEIYLKDPEQTLLIDFWATWCGPCRILDPILKSLADEFAGQATFLRVDVDESPELRQRFGIEAVPTVLIIANGGEVERFEGVTQKRELRDSLLRAGARRETAARVPIDENLAFAAER